MLTQERVRELFDYREDGKLIWRVNRGGGSRAGDVAGCYNKNYNYTKVKVERKSYLSHRLVWLYHHGYFPEHQIDHINRIRTDNRIENLREVNNQCNQRNVKVSESNTSGITGVSWDKRSNKWRTAITIHKKQHSLGYYDTILEAAKARHQAEVEHNWPSCNTTSSAYLYLKENQNA